MSPTDFSSGWTPNVRPIACRISEAIPPTLNSFRVQISRMALVQVSWEKNGPFKVHFWSLSTENLNLGAIKSNEKRVRIF
jgi:hypothetical protein